MMGLGSKYFPTHEGAEPLRGRRPQGPVYKEGSYWPAAPWRVPGLAELSIGRQPLVQVPRHGREWTVVG
jgi:hypothetical protein